MNASEWIERYGLTDPDCAREMRVTQLQFAIINMADRFAESERHAVRAWLVPREPSEEDRATADKLDRAATRQRRALRRLIDALAALALADRPAREAAPVPAGH